MQAQGPGLPEKVLEAHHLCAAEWGRRAAQAEGPGAWRVGRVKERPPRLWTPAHPADLRGLPEEVMFALRMDRRAEGLGEGRKPL